MRQQAFVRSLWAILGLVTFASLRASDELPCSIDVFGPSDRDPVVIGDGVDIVADCSLDFGDREVVLQGRLGAPGLTLTAGGLRVEAQASLEGGSSTTVIRLKAGALHAGDFTLAGALENAGIHGGAFEIDADGAVSLSGSLATLATDAAGNAGYITLEANGAIHAQPGSSLSSAPGSAGNFGGSVRLVSRSSSVELGGVVTAAGGLDSTGEISAEAATDLFLEGSLGVSGRCEAGDCSRGGRVKLIAGRKLSVGGPIDATGADGPAYPGDGNGGEILLDSSGDMTIATEILLLGGELSRGGSLDARSGGRFLQKGSVSAIGRKDASNGGSIHISAGADVGLEGEIRADGGADGDAGSIQIVAETDIVVAGPLSARANFPDGGIELVARTGAVRLSSSLDASSLGPFGVGGPIGVYAVSDITLDGARISSFGNTEIPDAGEDGLGGQIRIDSLSAVQGLTQALIQANGSPGAGGVGGSIALVGCDLMLEPGTQLTASGQAGGEISFAGSGAVQIASKADAAIDGLNLVAHAEGSPPDLTGSSFDPPPIVSAPENLDPCIFPVATGTGFVRADCNASGDTDISDAIFVLGFLFQGSPQTVSCEKACDVNDDAAIDISDAIALLAYLFGGGAAPPAPFGGCGADPTEDALTCAAFTVCP